MASKQFKKNDDLKLKLEKTFSKELKNLFNRINFENSQNIEATSNQIEAEQFRPELEALLNKQYTRVQKAFTGNVEKTIKKEDQGLSDTEEALLIAALLNWRKLKSVDSSGLITQTTQKLINESIRQAREIEQLIESPKGNKVISRDSGAILKKKFAPRDKIIAETETQAATEASRLMESDVLSGRDPRQSFRTQIVSDEKSTKMWITVGDDRVRPIHREVAGVEIAIKEIFIVGGESLLSPGDSSLGASAKNLVHCRCSLDYNIIRVRK